MRIFHWAATLVSLVTTFGYVVPDTRKFLLPLLAAPVDEAPKAFIRSIFYLPAVSLGLTTIILVASLADVGGNRFGLNLRPVLIFLAIQLLAFAIVQAVLSATSSLDGALFKLVPWIF